MRVLHVIPYYHPAISFGGPVTLARSLAEDLVRMGHEVSVLTTDVASRTERLPSLSDRYGDIQVRRLRNLSQRLAGKANCYTPQGAAAALDEMLAGSDVCHVFDYFTWLTYRAVERAHRRGVPTVISPQGSLSLDPVRGRTGIKTLMQSAFGDATLRRASLLHAVTSQEAGIFESLGVDPEKLQVIPNGVALPSVEGNASRFRARHELGDRPIVLFVGRLLAGKGVDLLLEVARRVKDRSWAFIFVGPAENRPDLSPGRRGDNVLLTGLLAGADLEDAFAAASFFTLPSYSEGLPTTALEAMCRGLPALLSDACNLPEVVAADAGLEVKPEVGSLAEGVNALIARRHDLPAMGARGRALVADKFSRQVVHGRMEAAYRALSRGSVA